MRALSNPDFDPTLPLQTRKGAKQALRCSHNKIDELILDGTLETVSGLGRVTKITTASILAVASGEPKSAPRGRRTNNRAASREASTPTA